MVGVWWDEHQRNWRSISRRADEHRRDMQLVSWDQKRKRAQNDAGARLTHSLRQNRTLATALDTWEVDLGANG